MLAFGVVSTATTKANSTSAFSSPRERVKTCLRVGAGGAPETRAKACRVGNWPEWQEGKGPFAFGRRVVVSSSPPASNDGDAALTFFCPRWSTSVAVLWAGCPLEVSSLAKPAVVSHNFVELLRGGFCSNRIVYHI